MIPLRPAPEHMRLRGTVLLAVVGLIGLVAASVVTTSAAFTSGVDAATTQSGRISLAQGPADSDRYPDSAHPHDIAVDGDGAQKIAYLATTPAGPPAVDTAAFTIAVHVLTPSRDVALRATLHDPAPAGAAWLLFDVRAGGASLLPSGIPLPADRIAALDEGAGLLLPAPDAGSGLALTVRVWLAPTAPPAAFDVTVTPTIAITAETVGGRTVTLKEKLR